MIINCYIKEVWNNELEGKIIAMDHDEYIPKMNDKKFMLNLKNIGYLNIRFLIENLAYWLKYNFFYKLIVAVREK
jgi:lipopolysaccharide biosynthesis glycosyltransferase